MMRRYVQSLLVGIVCLLLAISPQSSAKVESPFTLKVLWTSSYNDNILKYSQRDLNLFKTGSEVFPSEIRTTDDWINTFGIRAYREFNLGHKFSLRPYYAAKLSLYSVNSVKNYSSHFFALRFSYRHRIFLTAAYLYLPDYYLRIYQDRDWREYRSCDYKLYQPTLVLRYKFAPLNFEAEYGQELLYYNDYFTEYDSEAKFYGLKGICEFASGASVALGYQFRKSENVGFDASTLAMTGNPLEDTEAGNSSYQEDRYSVELSYPLPIDSEWNWRISLDFEHRLRYYQSPLTTQVDPFHAGRKDRRDLCKAILAISPTSQLDIELSYSLDVRRTESPHPPVPIAKNFDDHALDLTLIYQLF